MVNVCFCILTELLAKKKVTAKYLAEKYEISVRTVYRYLDVLAAGGVNFFTDRGRNGGIKIADDYKLSASYLTDAEKQLVADEQAKNRETINEAMATMKAAIEEAVAEAKAVYEEVYNTRIQINADVNVSAGA